MTLRELALLLCLSSAFACRKSHEDLLEKVQLAGCREVLVGPICEIEETTKLILFVKAPRDAQLVLRTNDEERAVTWKPAGDGVLTELEVTTSTRSISVEAKRTGTDRWDRSIVVWERPASLREANRLFRDGKIADAAAIVAATSTTGDLRVDGELEKLRAVLAMNRNDGKSAAKHWIRSAELGEKAGVLSKAVNDRLALAHGAIFSTRDLALARRVLDEIRSRPLGDDPRGAANLAYCEGELALQTGDFRGAISALESAELFSLRMNLEFTWWAAKHVRAEALTSLGHYERALELLAELRDHRMTVGAACEEANHLGRVAWAGLMAREAGDDTNVDVRGAIERALELVTGACPKPAAVPGWIADLALSFVQEGDYASARDQIARLQKSKVEITPPTALWLYDIVGRIALSEKDYDGALEAYDHVAHLAELASSPDAAWRARVGRATTFRAQGRTSDAVAAYREAEEMLDRQSVAISIGGGRSRFIAAKSGAVREYIELLIELEMTTEAIDAMRRARARSIAGLRKELKVAAFAGEQRLQWDRAIARYTSARERLDQLHAEDWAKAKSRDAEQEAERRAIELELKGALEDAVTLLDPQKNDHAELSGPEDDELILGFMKLARGWVGFALTKEAQRIKRIDIQNSWLEQFRDLLAETKRVRILGGGSVIGFDFHALLLDTHEVRYAIDIPRARPGRAISSRALIVADPNGDLPNARDEAKEVGRQMPGGSLDLLLGREASRDRVISALERAGVFHYAGHGRFAGEDGWESTLPLANAAELTIGDILALSNVPSRVVLSGCETAETSTLAGQQLGLAQTFVLSGSEEVVAATRPVKDVTARKIATELHRSPNETLSQSLRRAQKHLKQADPTSDWAAFRVFVP